MVKALINSINTTPGTTVSASNSAMSSSAVDFQKLFDKQNACLDSRSGNSKNLCSDEDSTEKTKLTPNDTFAGSVLYDIKQLIAFLNSATKKDDDSSTETEESGEGIIESLTSVKSSGSAENIEEENSELDADEITKKILGLEEGDKEDDEDKEEMNADNDTEVKAVTEFIPQSEDLTYNNLDGFLENFEVITEETPTVSETRPTPEENVKETEQTIEDIISEDELKELNIESIKAETSGSAGGDDIMQNQSPEEQGVKAMLQADVDFSEIKAEVKPELAIQNTAKPVSSTEVTPSKIIEQITKQMEGMYNGSKVNMVLNPESLGKVSIQLINTKEGLSAQFTVATQEARNLIMKGLDGLKDTLMSHGVSVDNVSVKINDTQETEYHSDWTEQEGSEGGYKEQGSNKNQKDKEQFEQTMSFIEDENGKV